MSRNGVRICKRYKERDFDEWMECIKFVGRFSRNLFKWTSADDGKMMIGM
ncbi:MAG: hypothetical protein IKJ59_07715 [Clostridia bacterium]|nr:hypothetical protein [Clostridia bacterium]